MISLSRKLLDNVCTEWAWQVVTCCHECDRLSIWTENIWDNLLEHGAEWHVCWCGLSGGAEPHCHGLMTGANRLTQERKSVHCNAGTAHKLQGCLKEEDERESWRWGVILLLWGRWREPGYSCSLGGADSQDWVQMSMTADTAVTSACRLSEISLLFPSVAGGWSEVMISPLTSAQCPRLPVHSLRSDCSYRLY